MIIHEIMNNKIVYIFLLFACFLWPAQNGYGKDFDTNLKKVKAEINRDNVKEAIKILGKIKVENEDQQERIDLLFGDIYLKINKPGKAIEFYEKVFATSDEDIESLGELGLSEANLRQGKLEESIEHANKSLAINADNIKGKIILAIAKTRNDEKNEALQILENLYQGHKNNSEVNTGFRRSKKVTQRN